MRDYSVPIVAAATALAALHVVAPQYLLHQGFPLDDSWIHAVYGRELARSGMLAYNPGIRATGETSPLWAILIAIPHLIATSVQSAVVLTKALGFTLHLASALLLAAALAPLASEAGLFVWGATALVAFHPHLLAASVSGMEVPLATFVTAAAIFATLRSKPIVLAAIGAAAFAGRPETPVLVVAIPFLYWIGPAPKKAVGLSLMGGFGAIAALAAISWRNHMVSGLLLPATFHAKVSTFSMDAEVIGFRDLLGHIPLVDSDLLLAALTPVSLVLLWKAKTTAGRLGSALMLSGLSFCAVSFALIHPIDTPVFYFQRYPLPAVLPMVAALPLIAHEIVAALPSIRMARPAATCVLAASFVLLAWSSPERYRRLSNDAHNIDDVQVAFGRSLAQASPDDTLWAVDAGALRFFGAPFVVDLIGLNTPEILQPDAQAFLDRHEPRYLDLFPSWNTIAVAPSPVTKVTDPALSSVEGLPAHHFETTTIYTVATNQPMRRHTLVTCDQYGLEGQMTIRGRTFSFRCPS